MSNPGSVVGDDTYDAATLEEQRVNRAVTGSTNRALAAGHGPREPKAQPTMWSIHVVGFPANEQQPLEVNVDGADLLKGTTDKATEVVEAPIQENGKASVTIKIPALGFANTREYVAKDGPFIKYEFTEKGLALAQQTTPF